MIIQDINTYKLLCIIKEKKIERLNKIMLQQKETIADLQQYLIPPKYKRGDIVNILGGSNNALYIIHDFVCYETSKAIYNVHLVNDSSVFETVSETDLVSSGLF